MNWFTNLKIAQKLLLGFSVVAIIAGIIGYIGITNIDDLERSDTEMYENMTVPITMMSEISTYFQRVRVNTREVILADTESEINKFVERINTHRDSIDAIGKRFEERILSDEMNNAWKEFLETRVVYVRGLDKLVQLAKENRDDEAMLFINGELATAARDEMDAIALIVKMKNDDASKKSDLNTEQAKTASLIMMIVMGAGILIALLLGIFISKVISNPIKNLSQIAESLALGDVSVKTEAIRKDELGDLERSFGRMIENIKEQSIAAEKIAMGDTNLELKEKSDKDVLTKSLIKVVKTVKELVSEALTLSKAAVEGKLSTRGNADKFNGGYRDIVNGVNDTINAVVQPISESSRVLEKLAQGNLSSRMTGDYKGDYGIIKESINGLASSFHKAISEVSTAIQATASASNQISSSTEEMAAGAQEQSAQTSEVASAVEQMTKTIIETTKNSGQASIAAKNAGQIAKEGGKVVGETIEGMNRVAEVVKRSADTVQALGKSSDEIGEIVQVIDDIADQTNLLALNAAIEAARAGEQGRGFAVVADEVRKLAERTTKATKEIASMIKQIQKDTEGAVLSMKEGTEQVERGKSLADEAGKSLEQIIKGAEEVVDIASQVAVASEEQSSAAEQISKNVESISSVTQQSAAGVQQIANAAEDLNRLTLNLQELVAKFNLEDNNSQFAIRQNGKLVHI